MCGEAIVQGSVCPPGCALTPHMPRRSDPVTSLGTLPISNCFHVNLQSQTYFNLGGQDAKKNLRRFLDNAKDEKLVNTEHCLYNVVTIPDIFSNVNILSPFSHSFRYLLMSPV